MEAAGIEPASRDSSVGASTCVSGLFEFNLSEPEPGGGLHQAVRKQSLILRVSGVAEDDPKLTSDYLISSAKTRNRGCLFLGSHSHTFVGN